MKADYDQKIEALETDNRVLKKTILEQQKFLEGMRRDKVKNNIFITGIPSSHTIKENNVTDKEIIIQHIIKYIKDEVNNGHYKIVTFFDPVEGRNNFSAKVTFNDYSTKMVVIKNCKKLGTLDSEYPLKKIRVRFDDPPLTRKENKRLSTKLYELRHANTDAQGDTEVVYKLEKGTLLKDGVAIDEFNLNNQIFA